MNFIKTFLAGLLAVVVGTFLVFFLWIFILLGIAGSMEKSVAVHPESILKIDFSEVLTDAPSSDPLAGLDLMTLQTQRQLPLLKALRALEAARDDDRIKGIYLRMNGTGGVTGSAILEELREALVEFKQSGKFIVAYNETYSQGGYYLASVADKIYMQPEGMMEWAGLSMNLMFYKGLLDKLDLKAEQLADLFCHINVEALVHKAAVVGVLKRRITGLKADSQNAVFNGLDLTRVNGRFLVDVAHALGDIGAEVLHGELGDFAVIIKRVDGVFGLLQKVCVAFLDADAHRFAFVAFPNALEFRVVVCEVIRRDNAVYVHGICTAERNVIKALRNLFIRENLDVNALFLHFLQSVVGGGAGLHADFGAGEIVRAFDLLCTGAAACGGGECHYAGEHGSKDFLHFHVFCPSFSIFPDKEIQSFHCTNRLEYLYSTPKTRLGQ